MPGPQGNDPAAHRGVFEGLGKVAAGVTVSGPEFFRGLVEKIFVNGSRHAGFHGDGLVGLVKGDESVHVGAHDQSHPAAPALEPLGHRAAAAVNMHRDFATMAKGDDGGHVRLVTRVNGRIGDLFHPARPEPQKILHGFAGGEFEPAVGVQGNILPAHDIFKFAQGFR